MIARMSNLNFKSSNMISLYCLQFPTHWLTDSNSMSTRLGLFYSKWLRNLVYCTFIFTFFSSCFLRVFYTVISYQVFLSNTNNLHTVVLFQVFLSNTNNYKVPRNYFYSTIVICLHIVLLFHVSNYYLR